MITALSTSCAPEVHSVKIGKIQPEFVPYVAKFEAMSGSKVSDIDFEFKDMQKPVIGLCVIWSDRNGQDKYIYVDPTYWNDPNVTEDQKVSAIFHEIGHCHLNRDHTTDKMSYKKQNLTYKVPSSFMYPSIFYGDFYKPLENYYFSELISPDLRKVD